MQPELSIVVATYQRPSLLAEAVRGALAQSSPRLQVIVVDDDPQGSAEDTVRSFGDARVTYLKRATHSGGWPGLVYDEGWRRAEAPLVAFLDDDDVPLPGGYDKLVAALHADEQRAFAFGRAEPFGDAPEAMVHEVAWHLDAARRARLAAAASPRYMQATLLFRAAPFVNSALVFRRDRLDALGGFSDGMQLLPQNGLALRAAMRWRWAYVDEPVVRYRVQPGSLIHDARNQHALDHSYRVLARRARGDLGVLEFVRLRMYARFVLPQV